MKQNKTILAALGIGLLVLVGGGYVAYAKFFKKSETTAQEAPKKKRVSDPVNVLPVAERPYMQIVPVGDGRNLMILVKSLKKPATEAEYELEYQAGSLLQGAFGAIELGKIPAEAKILLGSCSAGGACTYHTDVKGGTLVTRFKGEDSSYALKSDWKYIDNAKKETEFSSKDAKFQMASKDLASQRYLIIFNDAGYPEGLTGTPVSDPYSLTVSSDLKGTGTLTMRAQEEGTLSIMGWDGSTWKSFSGTVDGKSITAEVPLMELYIVVKQ